MTIKFIKLFFALVLVYFILENKIIDFEAFSKIDFSFNTNFNYYYNNNIIR